jgi:hypothetical protein
MRSYTRKALFDLGLPMQNSYNRTDGGMADQAVGSPDLRLF